MNTFERSEEFDAWLASLKDKVGGDKSSQKRDIKRAIEMARALNQGVSHGKICDFRCCRLPQ